ncbi:hypothetical protein F5887DRAFT_1244608 [Amanita rubescens]|nr:hypothetical protein F5887DRAFT_1244608 [Amanita rubescens]
MEYDSDEVPYDTYDESRSAPHEKEEKGSQDSKTLFDPPWMAKLATVDGIISDSDCTSASLRNLDLHYDDFRSPEKYKIRSSRTLVGPIKALIMQLIMLITMIVFVGWTSRWTSNRSELHGNRLPKTPTIHYHSNHVVRILAVAGKLLFSEAIRFSTIVWLGHRSSRRMSLYYFICYYLLSVRGTYYLARIDAQTSAWTTILAPRLMLISEPGSFQDLDFSTPFDACE